MLICPCFWASSSASMCLKRVSSDRMVTKSSELRTAIWLPLNGSSTNAFATATTLSSSTPYAVGVSLSHNSPAFVGFSDIAIETTGRLDLRVAVTKTAVRQGVDRLRRGNTNTRVRLKRPPQTPPTRCGPSSSSDTPPQTEGVHSRFGPSQTYRGSSRSWIV